MATYEIPNVYKEKLSGMKVGQLKQGLREAVISPLLEIFKTRLDEALSNMA